MSYVEDETLEAQLVMLFKSIARLAAPAPVQIAYLKARGSYPELDDLANDFDDAMGSLEDFTENGWITPREASVINGLDQTMGWMNEDENEGLWTLSALEGAPEWQLVRQRAWDVMIASAAQH